MCVMLVALQVIGFEAVAHHVKERWGELALAGRYAASPEFTAFSVVMVLDEVVAIALSGIDDAVVGGVRFPPSDSVSRELN